MSDCSKKVIAFSLWGNQPIYNVGALRNAELTPQIYPGWLCRFYVDVTVPPTTIEQLRKWDHVELITMTTPNDRFTGALWRFLALEDPTVAVTILRDTDSRLTLREKAAVDQWLASGLPFHIMRDHPLHRSPIMAGMWGARGTIPIERAIQGYFKHYAQPFKKVIDQEFLAEVVYPFARYQSLIHDEFGEGQPFPTPRQNNEYVGQVVQADETTIAHLDQILIDRLKPSNPTVKLSVKRAFDEGQRLKKQGDWQAAIPYFQEAIQIDPNYFPAYNNLGAIFQQHHRLEQALESFNKAIELKPQSHAALTNLGATYFLQGKLNEAESALNRALQIKPDFALGLYTLGLVYKQQARLEEAILRFQAAARQQPDFADAYFQLGQTWEFQSRFSLAKIAYQRCYALNPTAQHTPFYLAFVKLNLCDWEGYDGFIETLTTATEQYVNQEPGGWTIAPFHLNLMPISPALSLVVAQRKAATVQQNISANTSANISANTTPRFTYAQPTEKLRVGYLSPDFYGHAVGRLVADLFAQHNRHRVEVFGYSLLNVRDEVTATIEAGCDQFRHLADLSTEAAAQRINDDGIDILIDLAGYTGFSQPEILAYQPAPIQATFLGYPHTLGADFVQYFLTDEWVVPPELALHYREEVVYLPHQFLCSAMEISEQRYCRADFGVPESGFVFACFNRHYKITPRLFALWLKILQQVEGSVLWLSAGEEETRKNLRQYAQQTGVDAERLIFAEKLPHPEYLARLSLADLALDTLIYSGGSTSVISLYAGLPVLTLPGVTNATRMGASICASGGTPELICKNLEEYEQQAVYWATHPQALQALRQRLQQRNAPLFDVPGFARSLEAAFEQMQ